MRKFKKTAQSPQILEAFDEAIEIDKEINGKNGNALSCPILLNRCIFLKEQKLRKESEASFSMLAKNFRHVTVACKDNLNASDVPKFLKQMRKRCSKDEKTTEAVTTYTNSVSIIQLFLKTKTFANCKMSFTSVY